MKVIFKDIEPDDFVCASRAARWLLNQPLTQKDAILAYGQPHKLVLYVRRNKASITVRYTEPRT